MSALNLNLYLNLLLLPPLPRHPYRRWCCWLSAILLGKKKWVFFQIWRKFGAFHGKTRSGLGFYGGLVTTYPTTTGGRLVRKSSGPSHDKQLERRGKDE